VLPVQDHDTWQQQPASADDEVKLSILWVLPDHNPHRSSLVQVQDQVSIERNQNIQCIQIWGLQKPLFAGTEIILVGNLMTVIKPQPSHLMFVPLK
jgi:hypothetical protein